MTIAAYFGIDVKIVEKNELSSNVMQIRSNMCGACRVTVGGKTKFVCVDGPEFDAHQVDFDEMLMRLGAYKDINK